MSQWPRSRLECLPVLLALLGTLVFLTLAGMIAFTQIREMSVYEPSTGVIVQIQHTVNVHQSCGEVSGCNEVIDPETHYLTRFLTENGQTIKTAIQTDRTYHVQDRVPIAYDPNHPEQAYDVHLLQSIGHIGVNFCFFLLFCLISFLLFLLTYALYKSL